MLQAPNQLCKGMPTYIPITKVARLSYHVRSERMSGVVVQSRTSTNSAVLRSVVPSPHSQPPWLRRWMLKPGKGGQRLATSICRAQPFRPSTARPSQRQQTWVSRYAAP